MGEFVFAADLHLDDSAWVGRPELGGDAYRALAQIVDYCVQQRLPLILGGDIFDKRRPSATAVWHFCRQMDRMQLENLQVFFIQGQHELDRETAWLAAHRRPTPLHKHLVPFCGLVLYGLDWLPAGQLQAALDEIPASANVLVCHQVWSDFMGVGRTEGSFSDIPRVRYVLTGDYHRHEIREVVGKDGQPLTVFSPGSTCLQAIDEPAEKFFFHFTVQDNGELQQRSVPLYSRPVSRIIVRTPAELDDFCQASREAYVGTAADTRLILRVTFPDSLPEAYQRIRAATGDRVHLFTDIKHQADETIVDFSAAPSGAFDDLVSAVRQLRPGENDPVAQATIRVLDSPDIAGEVAKLYQEFMA